MIQIENVWRKIKNYLNEKKSMILTKIKEKWIKKFPLNLIWSQSNPRLRKEKSQQQKKLKIKNKVKRTIKICKIYKHEDISITN